MISSSTLYSSLFYSKYVWRHGFLNFLRNLGKKNGKEAIDTVAAQKRKVRFKVIRPSTQI